MVKCEKERSKLKRSLYFLSSFCAFMMAAYGMAIAEPAPNPRSAISSPMGARADGKSINRANGADVGRVASKRASGAVRAATDVKPVADRVGARAATIRGGATVARSAAPVAARAATVRGGNAARSAAPVASGVARAATTARATAVFNDVSKIGGGYAACREAYATCMDQFCANANDTYRRCYCSARFTEFRDTEYALDEARQLLQQFEDNSLNAIDKTAAEVNAMYSATVGEAAIKKDTSLAQKTLNEIGDLLSGKKKASTVAATSTTSLGVMSLDFSSSLDDVWGGGSGGGAFSSIFESSATDMSSLEGANLYNAANKQCMQVIKESCESSAVLNMASSAYGIMVTQDCNAYERALDRKREEVLGVVRVAEKTLRQARLEEYRAHNSADVNECLSRVREAILQDTACGDNYYRCLDYTGKYINLSTGEPIYTPELLNLTSLINLDDGYVGRSNAAAPAGGFDSFLDERRIYAESALDSCRDIADTVWFEFKRAAKIEIEQAQNEKIEEIKASCMETVRECYDTQSNHLKSFDDTTAQVSGGLAAYAAQQMCVDKLLSCANLYGNETCNVTVTNGKVAFDTTAKGCGMAALLDYANTVDAVRVAEGCTAAIEKYVTDTCTPTGDGAYPWNCRTLSQSDLRKSIMTRVALYCREPNGDKIDENATSFDDIKDTAMRESIERIYDNVVAGIGSALMEKCAENNGLWYEADESGGLGAGVQKLEQENTFYATVFGRTARNSADLEYYGRCVANTERTACLAQNDMGDGVEYTTFDSTRNVCIFKNEWYEYVCANVLNGEWSDNTCYWDSRNKLENE
ncbi:MAG: hypothetical protein IKK76_00925 [Alphaproteobacteria bacterium]|nr:hypothetical protein [Alphaproteobacteria bacterium]